MTIEHIDQQDVAPVPPRYQQLGIRLLTKPPRDPAADIPPAQMHYDAVDTMTPEQMAPRMPRIRRPEPPASGRHTPREEWFRHRGIGVAVLAIVIIVLSASVKWAADTLVWMHG